MTQLRIAVALLIISSSVISVTSNQQCRVLVLQDSNDYVYFQAGAVKALLDQYNYDVIVANGFAGLIGIQVAQGKTGDQIVEYWKQFEQSHVLKNWILGKSEAFINKPSFYNTAILIDTVTKLIKSAPLTKQLSILSTNINSGMAFYVNEQSSLENLVSGTAGSASQPYFFKPVKVGNKKLLAGSLITYTDYQTAIAKCRLLVGDSGTITLDSVLTSTKSISTKDTSKFRSYQMLKRYIEINGYIKTMNSYFHARSDHPQVNFQHIIVPLSDLVYSKEPFGNSRQVNDAMILQGQADSKVQFDFSQPKQETLFNFASAHSNLYYGSEQTQDIQRLFEQIQQ